MVFVLFFSDLSFSLFCKSNEKDNAMLDAEKKQKYEQIAKELDELILNFKNQLNGLVIDMFEECNDGKLSMTEYMRICSFTQYFQTSLVGFRDLAKNSAANVNNDNSDNNELNYIHANPRSNDQSAKSYPVKYSFKQNAVILSHILVDAFKPNVPWIENSLFRSVIYVLKPVVAMIIGGLWMWIPDLYDPSASDATFYSQNFWVSMTVALVYKDDMKNLTMAGVNRLLAQMFAVGLVAVYFIYVPGLWAYEIYLPILCGLFGTGFVYKGTFTSFTNTGLIALIIAGVDGIGNAIKYSAEARGIMLDTTLNRLVLTVIGMTIAMIVGTFIFPIYSSDIFYSKLKGLAVKLSDQTKHLKKTMSLWNDAFVTKESEIAASKQTSSAANSQNNGLSLGNSELDAFDRAQVDSNVSNNDIDRDDLTWNLSIDDFKNKQDTYSKNVSQLVGLISQTQAINEVLENSDKEYKVINEPLNLIEGRDVVSSLQDCFAILHSTSTILLKKYAVKQVNLDYTIWRRIDLDRLQNYFNVLALAVDDIKSCVSSNSSALTYVTRTGIEKENLKLALALKGTIIEDFKNGLSDTISQFRIECQRQQQKQETFNLHSQTIVEDIQLLFGFMLLSRKIHWLLNNTTKLSYYLK
eukprot:Awhi_evm1s13558